MRIDAHHHLWNYSAESYPWIDDRMQVLRRDFTPRDLLEEMRASRMDHAVAVQARQSIEETRFLLDHAGSHPFIKGVVGWVPLADPDVGRVLESFRDQPLLKGVRHVVQDEPDDRFLDRDDFNAGIRALRPLGLVYDILIYGRQLPMAVRFVDRHPEQRFVIDHIAKPRIGAAGIDRDWERGFRALAERPHVSCKFSALVTEVTEPTWTVAMLRPYWDVALEAFGPRRLMFGSDWPVCLLRSSYADWVAAAGALAGDLAAEEQAAFWGGNANREYRLGIG
jgi:L-fuconolactonase